MDSILSHVSVPFTLFYHCIPGVGSGTSIPADLWLSAAEMRRFATLPILSAAVWTSAVGAGSGASPDTNADFSAALDPTSDMDGALRELLLSDFVVFSSRAEVGLPSVSKEMPFDVSGTLFLSVLICSVLC